MARPKRTGLNYFPLDVTFFSDTRIRSLRVHHGTDGITMYAYCLCSLYSGGYYCRADDCFIDCASVDTGIETDKITQILNFCCEKGLFDERLFLEHGVLTSAAIQRRYQEAARSFRRDMVVDGQLWLLDREETLNFISISGMDNSCKSPDNTCKNPVNSCINPDNSCENSTKESKEKEIKENESKAKENKANQTKADESKAEAAPAERSAATAATASTNNSNNSYPAAKAAKADDPYILRDELSRKYGEDNVQEYEQKFRSWAAKMGHVNAAMYPTISHWMEQDGVVKPPSRLPGSSIDTDDILEELRRNYAPAGETSSPWWKSDY